MGLTAVRSDAARDLSMMPRQAGHAIDHATPIIALTGMSPVIAGQLAQLGVRTAGDLLYHLPRRVDDFGPPTPIAELRIGELGHAIGQIRGVRSMRWRNRPVVEALLEDGSGSLVIRYFNSPWMAERLALGQRLRVLGKLRGARRGPPEMANPRARAVVGGEDGALGAGGAAGPAEPMLAEGVVEAVYPTTAGLSTGRIAGLIRRHLPLLLEGTEDPLPSAVREAHGLPDLRSALGSIHAARDARAVGAGRRRLAFEELFAFQTAVLLRRLQRDVLDRAAALPASAAVHERIAARLPFSLTADQREAVSAICGDLARTRPMNRLLQGDVGCGKTVVALYACLVCVACGHQAAVLAPTELLAEQHYRTFSRYLSGSRVVVRLLTGSTPSGHREQVLGELAFGRCQLVVGTHALLEDRVRFRRLGLAVIDEQHKFGVRQRLAFRQAEQSEPGSEGGDAGGAVQPHCLVMTATPIPRSLALTLFGEMDVSAIRHRPPGRSPIVTRVLAGSQRPEAYGFLARRVRSGEQGYVVCPAVAAGETGRLRSAEEVFAELGGGALAGMRLGLVHGRLEASERESVMQSFRAGDVDVLVSTTVIEVGVDVPNATVMIVEQAERFGLSQLHQIRGRVGRGEKQGTCLLIRDVLSDSAVARLDVLAGSEDGFEIAEQDLHLRGWGDFFGDAQSGLPPFRFADPTDVELLLEARRAAERWLSDAGVLRTAQGRRWLERVRAQFGAALQLMDAG